jgi:lipopolysaccharide/colanic/teichoic acid biosynthesis glycosyltransferase
VVKRTIDLAVALLGLLVLGPVALMLRLHARTAGEGIEDRSRRGSTVAGEPASIPNHVVRGEAAGLSPVLDWVSDLGLVLTGKMSLVGVHRLPAPPSSPAVDLRGARPGLIVPPVHAMAAGDPVARADEAYVLGWSFARDVRLVIDRAVRHVRGRRD